MLCGPLNSRYLNALHRGCIENPGSCYQISTIELVEFRGLVCLDSANLGHLGSWGSPCAIVCLEHFPKIPSILAGLRGRNPGEVYRESRRKGVFCREWPMLCGFLNSRYLDALHLADEWGCIENPGGCCPNIHNYIHEVWCASLGASQFGQIWRPRNLANPAASRIWGYFYR